MIESTGSCAGSAEAAQSKPDDRVVLFFDIDNCLYSNKANVDAMMATLINEYFENTLGLSGPEAAALHLSYYRDYGLAIQGLLLHHPTLDVSDFNSKVDDALPLDKTLSHDQDLVDMLSRLDRSKVRPWLFTNAYKTHGERVTRLLGVSHLFEGLTFCDYFEPQHKIGNDRRLVCKPQPEAFYRAMKEAGVTDSSRCYFVDDSALNIAAAVKLGWKGVNVREQAELVAEDVAGYPQIRSIYNLPSVFPHLFKSE